MKTTKALVIDDQGNETPVKWFLVTLGEIYGTENVVHMQDPDRAEGHIVTGGYEIVFVDLMLTKNSKALSGIQVGSRLRTASNSITIVMYSNAFEVNRELDHPSYGDCIAAGADAVVAKSALSSIASGKLKNMIEGWISKRKSMVVSNGKFLFGSDLRTKAMLESVGDERIRELIGALLPDFQSHSVEAIMAGYSGSGVARVISRLGEHGGKSARNILKFSRSASALQDELRRRPTVGTLYEGMAKLPELSSVKRGDWMALLIPELTGALPLARYLENNRLSKKTKENFARLVEKALVGPANEDIEIDDGGGDGQFVLKYSFALEVIQNLEAIIDLPNLTTEKKRLKTAVLEIEKFLNRVLDGNSVWSTGNKKYSLLHGDMHCNNVWITDSGDPMLIDFGRSDYYPRLFDFAALDVDLLISQQHHDLSGEEFNQFLAQFPVASGVKTPTDLSLQIPAYRYTLLESMTSGVEGVTRAEYAECMVIHLLRYLRFGVPPHRKVVAALMCDQLIKKFGW